MKSITLNQYQSVADIRAFIFILTHALIEVVKTPETWRQRHIMRMQLANSDARILQDAGIDNAQRFIEANKPFWEA